MLSRSSEFVNFLQMFCYFVYSFFCTRIGSAFEAHLLVGFSWIATAYGGTIGCHGPNLSLMSVNHCWKHILNDSTF